MWHRADWTKTLRCTALGHPHQIRACSDMKLFYHMLQIRYILITKWLPWTGLARRTGSQKLAPASISAYILGPFKRVLLTKKTLNPATIGQLQPAYPQRSRN